MSLPKPKPQLKMMSFRLPKDVVAMIDEMAHAIPTNKTTVIEHAVRAQFRRFVRALDSTES